jgi:SnoaL-like domain
MDTITTALDRLAIIEVCNTMAWLADRRDWTTLLAIFADDVRLDYTSLNGGNPATSPKAQVVESWRELFERLAATQHSLTGHQALVTDDTATCVANFYAVHVGAAEFSDQQWVLGGHYRFELTRPGDRWLISGLTMTAIWESGDRALIGPPTTDPTGEDDDKAYR